jgi:hypothetical protein
MRNTTLYTCNNANESVRMTEDGGEEGTLPVSPFLRLYVKPWRILARSRRSAKRVSARRLSPMRDFPYSMFFPGAMEGFEERDN